MSTSDAAVHSLRVCIGNLRWLGPWVSIPMVACIVFPAAGCGEELVTWDPVPVGINIEVRFHERGEALAQSGFPDDGHHAILWPVIDEGVTTRDVVCSSHPLDERGIGVGYSVSTPVRVDQDADQPELRSFLVRSIVLDQNRSQLYRVALLDAARTGVFLGEFVLPPPEGEWLVNVCEGVPQNECIWGYEVVECRSRRLPAEARCLFALRRPVGSYFVEFTEHLENVCSGR